MQHAGVSDVVQKLWGFCHTLRHDGVDYGDYIEQLTYLLFLKMADEREVDLAKVASTDDKGKRVVTDCSWRMLAEKSGTGLSDRFAEVLRVLGRQPGLLGEVFTQAVSRFNNPVNLKRVIAMIDEEDWSAMEVDVKGAAFEGLLEKAASEGKKGAGQYFTPRPLIQSICRVMKPDPRGNPDFRICDPACGTGGFLVCAWEWLISKEVSGGVFDRADYFIRKKVVAKGTPWSGGRTRVPEEVRIDVISGIRSEREFKEELREVLV